LRHVLDASDAERVLGVVVRPLIYRYFALGSKPPRDAFGHFNDRECSDLGVDSQMTNLELKQSNYATNSGINSQTQAQTDTATALGMDDSFYLPPEAFDNPEFKRGLKLFLSPDGKAARMIISHIGDPATPGGISHIDRIRNAAHDAVRAPSWRVLTFTSPAPLQPTRTSKTGQSTTC
jgi:hypothetical protein